MTKLIRGRDLVSITTVKEFTSGNSSNALGEVRRPPNGNTVVCNWGGHGHIGQQPLMFEVTPDKQVVWKLDDYAHLRTISNAQLLDVPGESGKPVVKLLAELGDFLGVLGLLLLAPAVSRGAEQGNQRGGRGDQYLLADGRLQ